MKVKQPSVNPTNKLTAAVIGAAACQVTRTVLANVAPGWADEAMWIALEPIIIFACGWFTKDEANVKL